VDGDRELPLEVAGVLCVRHARARVNAILVAVELEVDQATGNPGQLATQGNFRALLHELLVEHLDAVLGCPLDVDGLDRVVVSSHSGGYAAAAASSRTARWLRCARSISSIRSTGTSLSSISWVQGNVARFDPLRADALRWADIYTESGGTATNSRAMAASAQTWFGDAGLSGSVLFNDTLDTLDAGAYGRPVLFKLSGVTVDELPQQYFEKLANASGFAVLP
jgi:hypothetical protein